MRSSSAVVPLVLLAACAGDHALTAPSVPGLPADLARSAFQITIDNLTGRVTVGRPPTAAAEGLSLSLVGNEVIDLAGSGPGGSIQCTWSPTPNNARQRRCTFDLALRNRLSHADLVTPTSFPKPPAGASGILVFPYAAAALGVPGGSATPSPDWDHAPYNFFNDFGGCGGGKTGDCYRWELFPSPLRALDATAPRTVGFDVDRNAQSVAVYIVVAADLRDEEPREAVLPATAGLCGHADEPGGSGASAGAMIVSAGGNLPRTRGFCSFALPSSLIGVQVVDATLRAHQEIVFRTGYGEIVVDHMDYGSQLEEADFDAPALRGAIGILSRTPTIEYKTLDVTNAVRNDIDEDRGRTQFRLRWADESATDAAVFFDATINQFPPELVIRYRNP